LEREAKGELRGAKGEVDVDVDVDVEVKGEATGTDIVRLLCDGVPSSSPSPGSSVSSSTSETRGREGETLPIRVGDAFRPPNEKFPLPPSSSEDEMGEEASWFWRTSCLSARAAGRRAGGALQ
jgi:hypothetical protein